MLLCNLCRVSGPECEDLLQVCQAHHFQHATARVRHADQMARIAGGLKGFYQRREAGTIELGDPGKVDLEVTGVDAVEQLSAHSRYGLNIDASREMNDRHHLLSCNPAPTT